MTTPLERAEQAVTEARSRVIAYLTSAGLSTPRATANADALIAAVRDHDEEIVRAEALRDDTGTDADNAYNQAIDDATNALKETP